MDYLDYTHPLPEMNLAIDEALLTLVDDGAAAPVLRFWESPSYFIVMGYSSPSQHDVHVAACQADGLAILRRCSGGGTVIQGPGCLNYALIDTSDDPLDLPSTTATIQKRLSHALLPLVITPHGLSDLLFENKKCIGNAERRKKRAFLYHGSILYQFDSRLMAQYLSIPLKQPAYRAGRSHLDFVTNLPMAAPAIKHKLRTEFNCSQTAFPPLGLSACLLAAERLMSKYRDPSFIYRA